MKKLSIPRRFFLVLWVIPFIQGIDPARAACEEAELDTRYCLIGSEGGKDFFRCNCRFKQTGEAKGKWVCRGAKEKGRTLPPYEKYDCVKLDHDRCRKLCNVDKQEPARKEIQPTPNFRS